jgi:hypothetical protein
MGPEWSHTLPLLFFGSPTLPQTLRPMNRFQEGIAYPAFLTRFAWLMPANSAVERALACNRGFSLGDG